MKTAKTELIQAIKSDYVMLQDLENEIIQDQKSTALKPVNKMTTILNGLYSDCLNVLQDLLKFDFTALTRYSLKVTNHTGKMKNINSLSTYKYLNTLCINNSKFENSICAKCYADRNLKMYPQLKYSLIFNTLLLKYTNVEINQIQNLNNCKYFRFEAFSDLQNEIHLTNLINISRFYKSVNFGLWTKNYLLITNYLKNNKLPKNVNLILSSFLVNKNTVENLRIKLIETGNISRDQIKTFTVYDYENNINCGGKSCINCLNCYTKNNIFDIHEKLK